MWQDSPNLMPEVNAAIRESELNGGIWWKDLPAGSRVQTQTQNSLYEIERRADGDYIRGNAKYCSQFTKAHIHGSTFGGSMIKVGWLGVGMYLEFSIPDHGTVTTSRIESVRLSQ